ncbi:MAG: hypothetical protein JXB38_02605 [Anaerolineales bacterium]|nr:hypothetical protein [Anaerolineales bacterium]
MHFDSLQHILRPAADRSRCLVTQVNTLKYLENLAAFAAPLHTDPIIVTPSQDIAREAVQAGLSVVTGSFPQDTEGSHQQFGLVIVPGPVIHANPLAPADADWQHALHAAVYLQTGGVLAYFTSAARLRANPRRLISLLQTYTDLRIWQVSTDTLLLAGVRRGQRGRAAPEQLQTWVTALRTGMLARLPTDPIYALPACKARNPYFRSKTFDPINMEALVQKRPWHTKALSVGLYGWRVPEIHPLMPLRAMHLGAVISAGALGSVKVISPLSGHTCIIRGRTLRRVTESQEPRSSDSLDAETTSTLSQEVMVADFVTEIAILDLDDGSLKTVDPAQPAAMQAFLEEFAEVLAAKAEETYGVHYNPATTPYWQTFQPHLTAVLDQPLTRRGNKKLKNLSGTPEPALTVPQRHLVASILLKLLGHNALLPAQRKFHPMQSLRSFILSGQTATGKTIMAVRVLLGLIVADKHKTGRRIGASGWPLSVFVTTLANLGHVAAEVRAAAPWLQPRLIRKHGDLYAALAEARYAPAPLVLVISRTALRQAQTIVPAFNWMTPRFERSEHGERLPRVACPTCGVQIAVNKRLGVDWDPDSLLSGRLTQRGQRCDACGAPLWQETGRQYSLALSLRRECKKRGLRVIGAIFDEVHEDARHSNQGQSMAWLADLAEYSLGMSGTIYGGVTSSIFFLLFRLLPNFRQIWGQNELDDFIQRYGNWRKRRRDDGQWGQRVELPGISPELIAMLLNHVVTLTQADVGLPMPPRCDLPVRIDPGPQEQAALQAIVADFKARLVIEGDAQQQRVQADPAALQRLYVAPVGLHRKELAPWSPAWCCPKCGRHKFGTDPCPHAWHLGAESWEELSPEQRAQLVEPEFDPAWRSAKERALIELAQQEKAAGRAVLVYAFHTGTFEIDARIAQVLSAAGFNTLNTATIPSDRLVTAINRGAYTGTDVFIANPARVGTGTNLLGTPTQIWYQPIYQATLCMQASARADRPEQTQAVRNIYMVNTHSAEMAILARCMEKIITIHLVGGIDYGGMAAVMETVGHNQSFTETMIAYVSQHVQTDLSSLFQTANQQESERRPTLDHPHDKSFTAERPHAIATPDLSGARQLALFGGHGA